MGKPKTVYSCQQCGYTSPKWLGRCPDCQSWGSLAEESVIEEGTESAPRWICNPKPATDRPQSISEISISSEPHFKTGLSELDHVLGGGIVPGAVILIGGDPGIGKSTLLLQSFSTASAYQKVLYVSGEESARQIKLRADRLRLASDSLYLLAETALEEIFQHAETLQPAIIVIDSIQTVYTRQSPSAPGSVAQVREAASQLMFFAKQSNTAVFIIGHVTKDGAIAGPRLLEHIVDTVLYFEEDRSHAYRILRSVKNRFGAVNEMGIFEMKGSGLVGVSNPSGIFLSDRAKDSPGSVVVASCRGERPLLVELQALVTPSYLGTARRTALGVDANRVSLLIAVLEKRAGLRLSGQDVYINVVSGIEINEPAIDLGIGLSIASSFRERPLRSDTVVFGEMDLLGEIRPIQHPRARVREAQKLKFKRCILPARNKEILEREEGPAIDIELLGVSHVTEALQWI